MNQLVTVCIPTTARPHFLRTALQSVQNQLSRADIGEIVVSENKGDRGSEAVAREFPELPIRYVFRDPTLPMLTHLFSTFRQARTPYVAILNDDDWWSSNHISQAVGELGSNPACPAYVAAAAFIKNEVDNGPYWIDRSPAVWLVAGMPSWLKPWSIDARSMLALGWWYTPFHWSSLVARTAALVEVLDILEPDTYHTHTMDRLVFTHLALRGALRYNPLPDTFVRWHTANWIKDQDQAEVLAVLRSTAALTERLATQHGWSVREVWTEVLARMPRDIESELLHRFHLAHTKAELRRYGFERFFHTRLPNRRLAALRQMASSAKSLVLGNR
jgi:glycosyltransferase involved in cell wall biosynthesis